MKATLYDVRYRSRIPAAIGACPDDTTRLVAVLNEAQERLLYEGKFHGTTGRFRFCAVDSCLTFPPQIATPEAISVCGQPTNIRTQWYEYLDGGFGMRTGQSDSNSVTGGCGSGSGSCGSGVCGCMNEAIYRGEYCTFADIVGTNKKVKLVCDLSSDVGKNVLLLGYDSNFNWVRTNQGGVILDGELVTLAQGAGTISTTMFGSLTGVQFPTARDGQIWAYEYNTTTTVQRLIGQYQAFEINPSYSRYLFPSISGGVTSEGTCRTTLVELIGKLNFFPVVNDSDYLVIPCIPALKEMCQAINSAEHEPDGVKRNQIIATGLATAKEILDAQLSHFSGSGASLTMNILGSSIGSPDPIDTLL